MGLEHTALRFPHWNYFLALEEDLERASRYVELVKANQRTYSLEFAHLLFASSSEVEVVMILLCQVFDPASTASKFAHCVRPLRERLPHLWTQRAVVQRTGLVLQPWKEWKRKKSNTPFWWQSYNQVKHARHTAFAQATMKNAVNALAALYVLVLELSRHRRDGDDVRVLETLSLMSHRMAPRARLFEVAE